MKLESDSDTSRNCCTWYSHQGIDKRIRGLGNKRTCGDIKILNVSGKKGGGGPISIEYSVDASVPGLEDAIKNQPKRLITVTRNSTYNININRMKITWKKLWEEKTTVWIFQATN